MTVELGEGEMMIDQSALGNMAKLFVALFVGGLFILPALAQSDTTMQAPSAVQVPAATRNAAASSAARKVSPYRTVKETQNAKNYYAAVWGIDNLLVRQTASGNLIRFSYRVTDPTRATVLGDKKATPYLLGQKSHALLQIPVMDKVGQLRQTGVPLAGQEYWMVFSNKGNPIKSGDRVNVMIGSFHADGLMVE
jgi:hypothetical protein